MRAWIWSAALVAAMVLPGRTALGQAADVTVFAAASLKGAMDAIAGEYWARTGKRVALSYAASPALARQIEQGAPADIFFSADRDWMDYLQQRNLIRPETRRHLLGNRVVLVAPSSTAKPVALVPGALRAALGGGRLAMASVTTVPAGKYGRAALEHLGLWAEASDRIAEAENVRAALTFVARGEAALGIVYDTDARAEARVAVVAHFPEGSHPPIVYPAAIVANSRGGEAVRFFEALRQPDSAAIFAREGFVVLN